VEAPDVCLPGLANLGRSKGGRNHLPFYFAVRPAVAEKLGAGNRSLDQCVNGMNYADVMVFADAEDVSQLWEFLLWRRPTRLL
jgi:hypothetical protein